MNIVIPKCSLAPLLFLFLADCNSVSSVGGSSSPISLSLSVSILLAPQDGTPAITAATVTGSSSSTLSVSGLPAGVTAQITQPTASGNGTVTFLASPASPSGNHSANITATAGTATSSQSVTIVVAVVTVVSNVTDTSLGINGQLRQFLSTSFQPAEWDAQFFLLHPTTEPAQLTFLAPQHIRIQGLSHAIPWKANSNPQQAADWDFSILDASVRPILSAADHSPEFQIAVAPPFSGLVDSSGHLILNSANLQLFSSYCANLVRYYNKGGFDWGGRHFQSASAHPITWWGIFNEYNINGLTPAEYIQLYNAVVPAMLAVDSSLKFSAIELADFDFQTGDPRNNLPAFVAAANAGGVNAKVDVASTHFYSSCNQKDSDTVLFNSIPNFVSDLKYFRQQLATRADLATVPVWVTENNVNADFDAGNGMSACNPGLKFVIDPRGTSPFFAAWRPYVFSQLGKAGNQALYHWAYPADTQYSEVDYTSGNKYLSYWVDYTLGQLFPVTSSSAPLIIVLTTTETSTVEFLATKNPDGSFVVMIVDRAIASTSDNNGPGSPRTIVVDLSALGNYSSVSQISLQAGTDLTNGPLVIALAPAPKLSVTLNGYGTAFLHVKP